MEQDPLGLQEDLINSYVLEEDPFNLPLEQAIIGALLSNNSCYDQISDFVQKEDFFEKSHEKLYGIISSKLEAGYAVDLITLTSFIYDIGIEYNYVKQLAETLYPSDNLRQYGQILKELATRRKLIKLGRLLIENGKSESIPVGEQLNIAEKSIFSMSQRSNDANIIQFFDGAKSVLEFTYNVVQHSQNIVGLPTGFKELDNLLGGLKKGELVVLAGRPSMGKTAFSTNIGVYIAQQKKAVLFISLEMSYEQLCMRIISSLSGVPLNNLLHAKITPKSVKECLSSIEKFKALPLFIYDSGFLSPGAFRSLLRQMKRQHNIELVVLDYLQLMEVGGKTESREQEISKISRSLKLIAKEIGIPIIALSQMSRDIEKRKEDEEPRLSDLRGSGSIEQDADVILFLFKIDGVIHLSVAKNRNGALGKFPLQYVGSTTTFKNFS